MMSPRAAWLVVRYGRTSERAVTLIEIMTVLVIISILGVLLLPVVSNIRERLERTACMSNLRSLHVAANAYVADHNQWPQIRSELSSENPEQFAGEWIDALDDYSIDPKGWICPTVQKAFGSPDYLKPDNRRIDYVGAPFPPRRMAPFTVNEQIGGSLSRLPWFFENANVHGNGQMIIFADGSIASLGDLL